MLIGGRPEFTRASFIERALDKVSYCCILEFVGQREGGFMVFDNFTALRAESIIAAIPNALMRRLALDGAAFLQVHLPDMADGFRQQISPLLLRTKQD
jgi:hypothetical protein